MKLELQLFDFHKKGNEITVTKAGKTKIMVRIVRDLAYPSMWRVVRADGSLSDMLNLARAKDVAYGIAESAIFIDPKPWREPNKNAASLNAT